MGRLPLVLAVTPVWVEAFPSLDTLPAGTEALFATSRGLFSSPAWWRTVVACGMPERTQACFLVAFAGEAPVALFPLRRREQGGELASLTTPYTCCYAPMLAPALPPATLAAVFAAFARFCRTAATTRLDALPEDWPALRACVDGARAAGLATVRFAHFGNWHADVHGLDWAGYLAGRPGALRETIRRRLRRAERRGDGSFQIVTDPPELDAGIAAYEHVYARSWKTPEPFPRFNAGLMRETGAAGLLRLGIWRIGDTAVAAQLWIVEQGTAMVLKLAHDEAFRADFPGTVLTALMLRTLLDGGGVAEIDFGRGDDAYKAGWAGQRRQRIGLVLANPRRPAGLAFLVRHALGRVRRLVQVSPSPALRDTCHCETPVIAGHLSLRHTRHCEARSAEAISCGRYTAASRRGRLLRP